MNITIQTRKYITERDANGWSLKSPYVGQNKETKENKIVYKTTYYNSFKQVAQALLDREAGHCNSIVECSNLMTKLAETMDEWMDTKGGDE